MGSIAPENSRRWVSRVRVGGGGSRVYYVSLEKRSIMDTQKETTRYLLKKCVVVSLTRGKNPEKGLRWPIFKKNEGVPEKLRR